MHILDITETMVSNNKGLKVPPLKININFNAAFTRKSTYDRISAYFESALPFWREIFNERLPRMSAPLFSEKGLSFDK